MTPPPMTPALMRAWECRAYGPPTMLECIRRPIPVPGPGDLLVRILATTVESGDVRVRTQRLPPGFGWLGRLAFGLRSPRQPVLGTVLAGRAVGDGLGFRDGDPILACTGAAMGCHGEFRVLTPRFPKVRIPEGLSFAQAASLPFGGLTALHFLRKAGLSAGERVLVLGASGAVGSACVQLARHAGAEVHGTASGPNLAWLRDLGAQAAWDRREEAWRDAGGFDVIVDAVRASSFEACLPALRPGGRYVAVAGGLPELWPARSGTRRRIAGVASERQEDLETLLDLTRKGVLRPTVDRMFPFEELAAAHAHVETGHKRGSAVVTLDGRDG